MLNACFEFNIFLKLYAFPTSNFRRNSGVAGVVGVQNLSTVQTEGSSNGIDLCENSCPAESWGSGGTLQSIMPNGSTSGSGAIGQIKANRLGRQNSTKPGRSGVQTIDPEPKTDRHIIQNDHSHNLVLLVAPDCGKSFEYYRIPPNTQFSALCLSLPHYKTPLNPRRGKPAAYCASQ